MSCRSPVLGKRHPDLNSRQALTPKTFGIALICRRRNGRNVVVTATLVSCHSLWPIAHTRDRPSVHFLTSKDQSHVLAFFLLLQVQDAPAASGADVEALLETRLEQHKDLVQGELPNGLKYVILPNTVPPERFEAHLEICAGEPHAQCERGMPARHCSRATAGARHVHQAPCMHACLPQRMREGGAPTGACVTLCRQRG